MSDSPIIFFSHCELERWLYEGPRFYTDEPAQPCKTCYLSPVTGRVGDVFSIRCEGAA